MGCLVTENRNYPVTPPCPPSVETATLTGEVPAPLSQIVRVDRRSTAVPDGGMPTTEVTFRVDIRDCNETQPLDVHVFVDTQPTPARVYEDVPPGRRSPFQFDVPYTLLAPDQCHRVELLVSGEFRTDSRRTPATPGDLGTATWWLAVIDDDTTTIDLNECPR